MKYILKTKVEEYVNRDNYNELITYLDSLPKNLETKMELIEVLNYYRLEVIYNYLLKKCKELLSEEEIKQLKILCNG